MRAVIFEGPGRSLSIREVAEPVVGRGHVGLTIRACGVCRTDLHVVDGDLAEPKLPLILGHEVVGVVDSVGADVEGLAIGDRVGVPWLGGTCRTCRFCRSDRENLCDDARFTGYTLDGGYADRCVAEARYCFPIPSRYGDVEAAPLLCAGLIGYRSFRMVGEAHRIGFYGFGAAAHILTQVAIAQGREVYAFTRPGDDEAQRFARSLGAIWAGSSDDRPPEALDAAILFAPVGNLVPRALAAVEKGGVVVCAGIHMSEIPAFAYDLLWEERVVRSVANLTRADGDESFALAARVPITTTTEVFALDRAEEALGRLRDGRIQGAAVLVP
ncbi:MAG: zinc-dependent alcohol dehydrogenase family protein [Planctomycetes bacterium]|nr:zinc-dependent alcohol dehydrogenase family protein [Planctomycetota bacterium]